MGQAQIYYFENIFWWFQYTPLWRTNNLCSLPNTKSRGPSFRLKVSGVSFATMYHEYLLFYTFLATVIIKMNRLEMNRSGRKWEETLRGELKARGKVLLLMWAEKWKTWKSWEHWGFLKYSISFHISATFVIITISLFPPNPFPVWPHTRRLRPN